MRPKADRHGAEPGEQLPVVLEGETRNTAYDSITESFIRQVSTQLKQTLSKLEETKKGTLSELGEKVEGIVNKATPESRDAVRGALEMMQIVTKQSIEAVVEEAVDALRTDCQDFQDILIEMDAEMSERHATAMAALGAKLDKTQQTGAVSGEPTTRPQAAREDLGSFTMSSRTNTSTSSPKGFEQLFGGPNRPSRPTVQGSSRPSKPTTRDSFKSSSQSQSKNRSSLWDRGGNRQDSVDSAEIGSESGPKTDVLLEPQDSNSTDFEDLDPMMRSILEAGEDLHQEFKKDASKAGTEEWKGEMEYADLQKHLQQALAQYNKQKSVAMHKTNLINELNDEIAKLKSRNLDLIANLESMAQASTGAANTPIANQFGHLRSRPSFPFNSAGGSPRPSNVTWLNMWLPKVVRLHVDRTQSAIQRCSVEEANCSKMLRLGGGNQTSKEKDCLTSRRRSSEQHRQDFTSILSFFDDLMRHSNRTQNTLADELSGMESAESIRNVGKMPTPDSSNSDGQTPTGTESSEMPVSESTSPVSTVRDASTSPKEPADGTHDSSRTLKTQGTTPEVPSPLAESRTPLASNTTPPEGNTTPPGSNTPPASNTAPPEAPLEDKNEQARELDVPASATLTAVEAIDSGVLGMWTFFAYAGLVAMTHVGAWVRVCKFIFRIFTYIMNQISRAVRLIWPFGRTDEEPPTPRFPKPPSPACFVVVMYYCAAFLTFQVYMASSRERKIWYEANGLTRKYMLERSRSESRWLIFGVDGNLMVGWKDVKDFFELIYMLVMKSPQFLYRAAYPSPPILEFGQRCLDWIYAFFWVLFDIFMSISFGPG